MPTFIPFPKGQIEQSICRRFEGQVTVHGDKPAVKSLDSRLTFNALNRYANRIAHVLLNRGDGKAEPVVLLCDQGAPLIAAILGVLKAGKFYVPLDPMDNPAHISHVLDDLDAHRVLTDNMNLALARKLSGPQGQVINVENLDEDLSETNPDQPVTADSLAYVYFTSGSTGSPKGVLDNHRNMLHNIMRYTNSLRIASEDRLTLLHSPNFSACVSSLFGALLNGACIFPFDLRKRGFEALPAWLKEERITIYHSVPLIFRLAVNQYTADSQLRMIRLEGDQALKSDVDLFRKYCPDGCILVNGLGTTETGICRQFFVPKDTALVYKTLPIGYQVEDMEIQIMDTEGTGQTGEIAVKSRFLSLGYWKNSELTKAAFFAVPQEEGNRMYKTGDLGRMHGDGCLEYLGRKSSRQTTKPERLPQSSTRPEMSKPEPELNLTPMEALLAEIWRDVFDRAQVTHTDNFFSLGGDSMKGMQIIFRLQKAIPLNLNLRQIFDYPVLTDLAKILENGFDPP